MTNKKIIVGIVFVGAVIVVGWFVFGRPVTPPAGRPPETAQSPSTAGTNSTLPPAFPN